MLDSKRYLRFLVFPLRVAGFLAMLNETNEGERQMLSETQQRILDQASGLEHGLLVRGHTYRTAESLERKGLGSIRYQGPSLGWFTVADKSYDRLEILVALEGGL